jgi:hypothetical protein
MFRLMILHFDLPASIELAHDSFFIAQHQQLRLAQVLGADKLELRALIAESGERIAVASLNRHRFFFSRRFGMTRNQQPASTACVGFGLERLVFAILSRHRACEAAVRAALDRWEWPALDDQT